MQPNRTASLMLRDGTRNVIGTPAWATGVVDVAAPPSSMTTWTVGEVASWLESQDMAGPAMHLRAQGVDGQDLMDFRSEQELSRDLGTSIFLARKVLRLRDAHVATQP